MNKNSVGKRNMKVSKGLKRAGAKKNSTAAAPPAVTAASQAAPAGKCAGNGGKTVTIEAKIDVGFGNSLYLRGEGHGLNWNQGVLLRCVDNSTWKWTGEADDKLRFKLLLNDAVWAKGEDLEVAPGEKLEISPAF
jgi:hypothetical protein